MRLLLIALLVLGISGVAIAATTSNSLETIKDPVGIQGGSDMREGGEDIASALVIGSLPFSDTGATCDNINDYDEVCSFTGSLSPDVVYAYSPTSNETISIDLCDSQYDTKVYVYRDTWTPGNPYACNDDAGCGYSGYQSLIENLLVESGYTYYIVVDGYGSGCGDYVLSVEAFETCVVDCGGAPLEGEPPLVDGYEDNYNGGCNTVPPSYPDDWQLIPGDTGGNGLLCGRSGTYLDPAGSEFRDTDWFNCFAAGGSVVVSVTPEVPVNVFELSVDPSCATVAVVQQITPGACETGSIIINASVGQEIWLWVGPTVYTGVPEFTYLMEISGLDPGTTPVEAASWSALKATYR